VTLDPTPSKQKLPAGDARAEGRIAVMERVELSSLDQPAITEPTNTQNISSHGARVMTQRIWEPGSRLLIRSLRSDFWARARVVYWRSFSSTRYAVGLEFLAKTGKWPEGN
jgi:PilZ domain